LKTPSVLAGVLYREGAEPQRKRLPQIQSLEENKRDTKEKAPQHSSSCPLLYAPACRQAGPALCYRPVYILTVFLNFCQYNHKTSFLVKDLGHVF
jgi:hypothetical protein